VVICVNGGSNAAPLRGFVVSCRDRSTVKEMIQCCYRISPIKSSEKMVVLQLDDEQVIELVNQLSNEKQLRLYKLLIKKRHDRWIELSNIGQIGARRAACDRGLDWDSLTENEREDFINDLVHEDRVCA
jgi:hypothetical protein